MKNELPIWIILLVAAGPAYFALVEERPEPTPPAPVVNPEPVKPEPPRRP